jgi:LemA protein
VAGLIAVVAVPALLGVVGLWAVGVRNGLVRLRSLVQESWRQIDIELTRRHDLIPDLLDTARRYAGHERRALDAVAEARAAAMAPGAPVRLQAVAEGGLSAALGRLFAVAEGYPGLTADETFLALQAELTETEDRVAAGRRFYNANVREFNTRVDSLPSSVFARAFDLRRADYFEIADVAVRANGALGF